MVKFLDLKRVTAKYSTEIQDSVRKVIDSGWYLLGEQNKIFEDNYSKYIGVNHCIGVANGLDALRIILKAYVYQGLLKKGDEIIVPANTFIATILAITDNDLIPVLVEPDIDTFQIDATLIEKQISIKTKALIIVHLYGQCAYNQNIEDICKRNNLILIEDNAQAHGCVYNNQKTGSIGHASGHSFYPGKNLGALGDAGAITTNSDELAEIVRSIANYGSNVKYSYNYKGYNSRLDELQAAVLNIKLKYLNEDIKLRQEVAKLYINNIQNSDIKLPNVSDWSQNVFHIFPILCSRRDQLKKFLQEHNIETLIHYPIPPHKQKCYKEWNHITLPITEKIHSQELSLPMSPVMDITEVKEVIEVINSWK